MSSLLRVLVNAEICLHTLWIPTVFFFRYKSVNVLVSSFRLFEFLCDESTGTVNNLLFQCEDRHYMSESDA